MIVDTVRCERVLVLRAKLFANRSKPFRGLRGLRTVGEEFPVQYKGAFTTHGVDDHRSLTQTLPQTLTLIQTLTLTLTLPHLGNYVFRYSYTMASPWSKKRPVFKDVVDSLAVGCEVRRNFSEHELGTGSNGPQWIEGVVQGNKKETRLLPLPHQ